MASGGWCWFLGSDRLRVEFSVLKSGYWEWTDQPINLRWKSICEVGFFWVHLQFVHSCRTKVVRRDRWSVWSNRFYHSKAVWSHHVPLLTHQWTSNEPSMNHQRPISLASLGNQLAIPRPSINHDHRWTIVGKPWIHHQVDTIIKPSSWCVVFANGIGQCCDSIGVTWMNSGLGTHPAIPWMRPAKGVYSACTALDFCGDVLRSDDNYPAKEALQRSCQPY